MNTSLDKNSPIREKVAKVELAAKERLAEIERLRSEKEKKKSEGVGKII